MTTVEIVEELTKITDEKCICIEDPKTDQEWVLCKSCQAGTILNDMADNLRSDYKVFRSLHGG